MTNEIRDPEPKILRIEELVTDIKKGYIKLPRFQRGYVWKQKDIIKLLDSLYKGYPIGNVLLWITEARLASIRTIGDIQVSELNEKYPTKYILDGQQRLSTVCGILSYDQKDKKSLWNVVFDVERSEFVYPVENEYKITYFALYNILDTITYVKRYEAFVSSLANRYSDENVSEYKNRIERLLKAFKDYKLPTIVIEGRDIKDVSPIFERINSSGIKLSFRDLVYAKTWTQDFDINDKINSIKNLISK